MDPSVSKRLCHMIRAAYIMFRKGLIRTKLMIHLHLLLRRGKLAGKALTNSLLLHRRHHHLPSPDITGLTDLISFYDPGDVEFSCANTPSPAAFSFPSASKRLKYSRRSLQQDFALDVHLAAALAKELEVLGSASPVPVGRNQRSLAPLQLRVSDSPFPETEDEAEEEEKDIGRVDREAEAFIRRFYEQFRLQQCTATATPDRV